LGRTAAEENNALAFLALKALLEMRETAALLTSIVENGKDGGWFEQRAKIPFHSAGWTGRSWEFPSAATCRIKWSRFSHEIVSV